MFANFLSAHRSAAFASEKNKHTDHQDPVGIYRIHINDGFELREFPNDRDTEDQFSTFNVKHTRSSPKFDKIQRKGRQETSNEYDEPWPDLFGGPSRALSPTGISEGRKVSNGASHDGYETASISGQLPEQMYENVVTDGARMTEAEFYTTVARRFNSSTKVRSPTDRHRGYCTDSRAVGPYQEQHSLNLPTRSYKNPIFCDDAQPYAVTGILLPLFKDESLPNEYDVLGAKEASKNSRAVPEKHYDHAYSSEKEYSTIDREREQRGSDQQNVMATNIYAHLQTPKD